MKKKLSQYLSILFFTVIMNGYLSAETIILSEPKTNLEANTYISANLDGMINPQSTAYVTTWTWTGPVTITDGSTTWVSIVCDPSDSIPTDCTVTKVVLYHSITHTYIGDLNIQVTNEDGTVWTLRSADTSNEDDDIDETLTNTTTFTDAGPDQIWYYQIRDLYKQDTGTLNEIALSVYYSTSEPDISLNVSEIEFDCSSSEETSATEAVQSVTSLAAETVECQIDEEEEIRNMFARDGNARVIVNLKKSLIADAQKGLSNGRSTKQFRAKVKEVRDSVLDNYESRKGFKTHFEFDNIPSFSATLTAEQFNELKADSNVASIEPVKKFKCLTAQGLPLINAFDSRSATTGSGISIAICDTGLDYEHPMLGGGGFPNDKVIGGYDFGDDDSDPMPYAAAHGTACAGIAAGYIGSYGDYVGGVAPGAKLYALKVTEGTYEYMYDDAIADSWDWCVTNQYADPENPILVISVSLGGDSYSSVCDGITTILTEAAQNAADAGITIVAASGNEGYCDAIAEPACISNIISVGATYDMTTSAGWCVESGSCVAESESGCDSGYMCSDTSAVAGEVSCYSNSASILDVLAPSYSVTTLDISGSGGYSTSDYVTEFAGTSAATPYVSGAVAMLQQAAYEATGNYLTPDEVRSVLVSTGNHVYDQKSGIYTPLIDLEAAAESLVPCDGKQLKISNEGKGTLTITGIALPIWITTDQTFPVDIAASGTLSICLTSDCSSVCAKTPSYSDDITINSNDPDTPSLVIPVVATCAVCNDELKGDITGDCNVNLEDIAALALDWLECGYSVTSYCN